MHKWRTGDGREMLPREMDTNHIVNSINLLRRRGGGHRPIAKDFVAELAARAQKNDVAAMAFMQREAIGAAPAPEREEILVAPGVDTRIKRALICA